MNAHAVALDKEKEWQLDGRLLLRGVVLLVWAGFFAWLWISGEVSRYLGPRTYWVVPFGALTLGGAALMHAFALRTSRTSTRPTTIELVGAAILTIPLAAVAIVPSAELGSLASSRKSSGGAVIAEGLSGSADPIENPSFREITYAEESQDYADAIGVVEGANTELVGFIDDSAGGPEGTVNVTRFYVSCCAADAVPYSVAVDASAHGAADSGPDTWVDVKGTLERRDDRFVVVASAFEVVEEPQDPYLY